MKLKIVLPALALTAAETGHLCFGTLHTTDAASTIDRIIDVFPATQQDQIRIQLASKTNHGTPCEFAVSGKVVTAHHGKRRDTALPA